MKKVNIVFSFIVLLVMVSCGSTPEERIKGKWLLSDIKVENSDGSPLGDKASSIQKVKENILAEEKTYHFKDDENFSVTTNGETSNGTYQAFDLDGKISIALYEEDMSDATKLEFEEVTEDKMVSKYEEQGMVFTYTYTKQ